MKPTACKDCEYAGSPRIRLKKEFRPYDAVYLDAWEIPCGLKHKSITEININGKCPHFKEKTRE